MEGSLDRLVSSEAALDPSTVTFKQETVQKLFSRHWDAKTKGQLLIKEPLQTAPFNTFTTGIMPSRSLTTSQSLDSAINLDMGNSDGMKLAAEYLRCFTIEAAHRAAEQAKMDGSDQVEPEHLEKILPQLLLDF